MTGPHPALTDQDREDRRRHLDHIQGIVNRLANASATIKGWSVTIAGAAFGVASIRDNWYLWFLGLAGLFAFAILDVHYLRTERDYRDLHEATRTDQMPAFCLDPSKIPTGALPAGRKSPWKSWSVTNFYVPLLVAGTILTAIAAFTSLPMKNEDVAPNKPEPTSQR